LDHIYPIDQQLVTTAERNQRNGHKSRVFWLTGLSGSGKSTLAIALERKLFEAGHQVIVLDGDNIRHGINRDLGFSEADRHENIRRIAEIARLFAVGGYVVISSFISPTREIRHLAKTIIGAEYYLEIFVDASLETCINRDVKGLYRKAIAGEIPNFTGISSPFEAPEIPDLHLDTNVLSVHESTEYLTKFALQKMAL
jgi:adenylylsulfate kinase